MNLTIHQSIVIHQLRVNSVNNSSILQIGSAGIIKPVSNLFNTGGFTSPAPQIGQQALLGGPAVPFPSPT